MLLLVEQGSLGKIEGNLKASRISLRLPAGTMIRKAIILSMVPSLLKYKTSCCLGNYYVDDYKFGG